MTTQSNRIYNEKRIKNEESTTSFKPTLSLIAQDRMQHIWITFIDGVKSLYEFAVCLNKPIFDPRRLQELSRNAQEKMNLAEQDIRSGENNIKDEIHRLVLLRQTYEHDKEDLNNRIKTLSQKIIKKQRKIKIATDEVEFAERQVETQMSMKRKAQIIDVLAISGTTLFTIVTFHTVGRRVGGWAHKLGNYTTAITNSNLEKSRKAVEEKSVELKEKENRLSKRQTTLNHINKEMNEKQIKLNNLEISHEKLLDYSKLLTKLKSCISQCHDYINITLGRVDMLNERHKVEIVRGNIKQMIEKLVEHLLDVQSLEGHFPIMQKLKSLILEMQSRCTEPVHIAVQEMNDYGYIEGCYCSYCSIGILLSSVQHLFCRFGSFRP